MGSWRGSAGRTTPCLERSAPSLPAPLPCVLAAPFCTVSSGMPVLCILPPDGQKSLEPDQGRTCRSVAVIIAFSSFVLKDHVNRATHSEHLDMLLSLCIRNDMRGFPASSVTDHSSCSRTLSQMKAVAAGKAGGAYAPAAGTRGGRSARARMQPHRQSVPLQHIFLRGHQSGRPH